MKICTIKDCDKPIRARGYCVKHWSRWSRHGNPNKRSYKDRNEIVVMGSTAKILLYEGGDGRVVAEAIIDTSDIVKVRDFKWALSNMGYCYNFTKGISLHGLILDGKGIDHIDGNPLNNRRSNLRKATQWQNSFNTKLKSSNTSGYKGVAPDTMTKKPWRARIKYNYQQIHIGRFNILEEAAWMYDQYALELYGEFARTNFEYSTAHIVSHSTQNDY